jgi:hypothetical protein
MNPSTLFARAGSESLGVSPLPEMGKRRRRMRRMGRFIGENNYKAISILQEKRGGERGDTPDSQPRVKQPVASL